MNDILENAIVNYDALSERLSNLLNREYNTAYLLCTLEARAKASGYEGFALFFKKEKEYRKQFIEILTEQILVNGKEIKFNQIDAIPNRGSKLIDLINIYEDCLNKNRKSLIELVEFASQDIAMKIIVNDTIINICNERYSIDAISKIKKMISKAVNNYGVMLTIDEILKNKYS